MRLVRLSFALTDREPSSRLEVFSSFWEEPVGEAAGAPTAPVPVREA